MSQRRLIHSDEELGKRDDNFRARSRTSGQSNAAYPWRWRKRRIVMLLAGLAAIWLLADRILANGGGSTLPDPSSRSLSYPLTLGVPPTGPPPKTDIVPRDEESFHYYEGRIRYYHLATTLHAISKTHGTYTDNRNILFAASSLKSVANLLPLACAMGKWDRNYVHFAVMGRDPMSWLEIMEVNGVDDEECRLFLHDARSDYSEYSTDKRAAASVLGAMAHIRNFMHPQAIITDNADMEDAFFMRTLRDTAQEQSLTHIEIPKGKYHNFLWMTKLDSGSLASWHVPTIEILIHAPRQSSGGLLRTVNSIQNADYTGLKPPKLTIELPPDVDMFATRYLASMSWPPDTSGRTAGFNAVSVHHRIPSSRITSDEASLRFVESFYPIRSDDDHVLVVSSQAELDPLYYQFLYYAILEYRYSSYGAAAVEDLLGISLDTPATLVDGITTLNVPHISQMTNKRYTESTKLDQSAPVSFLYGAPTSTASLFFGDKWTVLHNFLRLRLAANRGGLAKKSTRLVHEAQPMWMEYFLELIRAKGWFVLHPPTPLLTVHSDLARIPEEYRSPSRKSTESEDGAQSISESSEETFLTAPDIPSLPKQDSGLEPTNGPLHEILPFDGDLPELPHLPYLDHTGRLANTDDPRLSRLGYSIEFRQDVGACTAEEAGRARVVPLYTAEDLFCLSDMEVEFAVEVRPEGFKETETTDESNEPSAADTELKAPEPSERTAAGGAEQPANDGPSSENDSPADPAG